MYNYVLGFTDTLHLFAKRGLARIYVCKKEDKGQCMNRPGISLLLTTEFKLGLLKLCGGS
jgi:hypothetical protein